MTPLDLLRRPPGAAPPTVALLAAHADDVELGAGGLLLELGAAHPGVEVAALLLTSTPEREAEARAALAAFLPTARLRMTVLGFPDGRLPAHWNAVKDAVVDFAQTVEPDLVLGPAVSDAHQDHALLGGLITQVFRDHLVFGYEILKWDGDLTRPTVYLPLSTETAARKWELLDTHYASQRHRDWFDREAVLGLARLRGVECHTRYAEAFTSTKAVVSF